MQIADKIWLMDKQHGITIGTPEDLALEGHLSSFFARKGIVFDMETGLFRIENQYTSRIRLVGHRAEVCHGTESVAAERCVGEPERGGGRVGRNG